MLLAFMDVVDQQRAAKRPVKRGRNLRDRLQQWSVRWAAL